MEVDSATEEAVSLSQSTQLLAVFTALAEKPNSELLNYRNVVLSEQLGLPDDELESARDTLVSFFPAFDDVWIPLLNSKVARHAQGELSAAEVDATFERAERDYFSIPVFKQHLLFFLKGNEALENGETVSNADAEIFSMEAVKEKASVIVSKASVHTTEGHLVWNEWRDWLQQIVGRTQGPERDQRLQLLKLEYLKRLTTPHSTNEETFQSYSTFVSTHLPANEYESNLVHASKVRQPAVAAWRNRERFQLELTTPQAYQTHLSAEERKRSKSTDPRLRDPGAIINIYERALAHVARERSRAIREFVSQSSSSSSVEAGVESLGGDLSEAIVGTFDAWLASFWTSYVAFLREEDIRSPELELPVLGRAVRSVPGNGELWLSYIRALAFHDQEDSMLDVYQLALGSGKLSGRVIADLAIPSVLPTYRLLRSGFDVDMFSGVISLLEDAIRRCREAGGDSRLKLESFLVHVYLYPTGVQVESFAEESLQGALSIWEDAAKHYKKHYHVWTSFVEFLVTTLKNIPRARKAFRDFQGAHLAVDYPEAVYEAWIAFEEKWGDATQLEDAIGRVNKLSVALGEKRARDAIKAARNGTASRGYGTQSVIAETVTAALPAAQPITIKLEDVAMADADAIPSTSTSNPNDRSTLKRKAEGESPGPESKKTKPEAVEITKAPLKRDRERCTVFVAGLPASVASSDLEALFKDCGAIHEIKLAGDTDRTAAVEFADRESIPAALTKDKKRVGGHEISVYQGWQSTLYVTNFPEKYDDAAIRDLFGKYGAIFDVRWPSKRIKTTRRFCYVQYVSPASAQAALVLDNFLLDQDRRISVAISNPEKKKERTDADADQREIHVGGLSQQVVKEDLEALFGKYGPVKDVRLGLDDRGKNKGFAFVEFGDTLSATAALAANNTELKKRRIAVTLSDPRAAATSRKPPPASGLARQADSATRKVRVSGLPEHTQEPLLQQALEKVIEKIVRVTLSDDTNEALVELETPADASKMVLLQTLRFQEHQLVFAEEFSAATNASRSRARTGAGAGNAKPAKKGLGFGGAPKAKLALPLNRGSSGAVGNVETSSDVNMDGDEAESSTVSASAAASRNEGGKSSASGAPSAFVPRAAASSKARRGLGEGSKPGLGLGSGFVRQGGGGGGDASVGGSGLPSNASPGEAGGSNGATSATMATDPTGVGSRGGKNQDAFRQMLGGAK